MDCKHMGDLICELRKEKAMTQKELADILNVTDKAVSKWERGISCPDISTLPRLASVLGVSCEQLLNLTSETEERSVGGVNMNNISRITNLVFKGVGLAMGVATVVMSIIGGITAEKGILFLGISAVCFGIVLLDNEKKENE